MRSPSLPLVDAFGARASRLLPWLAVLLAAALCVWLAVQLVWSLLTRVGDGVASTSVATSGTAPATVAPDVAHWHLFGNGQQNQIAVDIAQAGTRTTLKLTLHGTVADRDGRGGYALIADEHGVEHSYRAGDRIADGVTLAAVYADHVVLDNHGRHESLDLPRESLHAAPPPKLPGATAATGGNVATTKAGKPARPIYVAPNIAAGRVDWQQAQAQMRSDPMAAMQQFDLQPVLDGTRLRGVRLGGGASNPLVAVAGLRPDDVVTAVNGVPLDSLSRGQELMQRLQGARHIDLTVERSGQTQTLSVDLPQQ
jgi:general secretion pathway protein C